MTLGHPFRLTSVVRTIGYFVVMIAACSCVLPAHSQDRAGTATLYGTVRNAQAKPIPSATLRLQSDSEATPRKTQSDVEGKYSFTSLRGGVYVLRVEMAGYGKAEIASIFLGAKESKTLDLTLETAKASGQNAPGAPEFFDPPQFTVSGVTDTTNLGGHGSDTVVRTRETIAKETASLAELSSKPATSDGLETSLREQVEHEPGSYAANHALGESLVQHGKFGDAIPYLKHAAELDPKNDENTFDLAIAYCKSGEHAHAREIAEPLVTRHDTAEIHHLVADIEEKSGNSLEAVREYQRAAELDPSEPNFFDWGSELLLHHAPEPAAEVFAKGAHLFPQSVRMLVGLGAAEFGAGSYDKAVERLCTASDLKPDDPLPYLFLGKIQRAENTSPDKLLGHLHRFVTLHRERAEANYFYAVALWKQTPDPLSHGMATQVESLLNEAVRLDPNFGSAYLQLGIVHAEQQHLPIAISDFQHAVQASPELEEAHYRLAQAYREAGQIEKAKAEVQQYQHLAEQSAKKNERERHEIRQFVYTLRDQPQKQ